MLCLKRWTWFVAGCWLTTVTVGGLGILLGRGFESSLMLIFGSGALVFVYRCLPQTRTIFGIGVTPKK